MRRRACLLWIGSALVAPVLPSATSAQQRVYRLAFVHSGIPADKLTESDGPFWVRRLYQALRQLGYVEGQNLIVERFSADGRSERFAPLADEVVSRKPDVIILNLNNLAKIFMVATSTIPLVAILSDPIATGLLTNLAHPGGNLTGVSINAGLEIYGKRLQIIQEAMPKVAKVAALFSVALSGRSEHQEAARKLGIELTSRELAEVNEVQIRRTFAEIAERQFDAVIVDESGSFLAHRGLMATLGEEYRLLVLYPYRDYVEVGGPIAYAPDLGELAQRIANDVHQIFNGSKVGDIPFYQPSKFQLIVNARSARALDLSPTLLARADEVIE